MDNRLLQVTSIPSDFVENFALLDSCTLEETSDIFRSCLYEAFLLKLGLTKSKISRYDEIDQNFICGDINYEVNDVYHISYISSFSEFDDLCKTSYFTWSVEILAFASYFLWSVLSWKYRDLLHLTERRRRKYALTFLDKASEYFYGIEEWDEPLEFARLVVLHAEVVCYIAAGEYNSSSCSHVLSLIDQSSQPCYLSSRQYFDTILGHMENYANVDTDAFYDMFINYFSIFFAVTEGETISFFTIEYGKDVVEFLLREDMGEFKNRTDKLYLATKFCVDKLTCFFSDPDEEVSKNGFYKVISYEFSDSVEYVNQAISVYAEVFKRLYPLL